MKISKLNINQYRQLENLDFDFTYPIDFHIEEKRGKPLDKICFIGQSGTGKTGLLELIYSDISNIRQTNLDENNNVFKKYGTNYSSMIFELENKKIETKINDKIIDFDNGSLDIFIDDIKLIDSKKEVAEIHHLFKQNNIHEHLIYFQADILCNQNIKIFEEKTAFLIEKYKHLLYTKNSKNYGDFVFGEKTEDFTWVSLLHENILHNQDFFQFASELINSGNVLDNSTQKKVDDWKIKNKDPLMFFSKKFNLVLNKINLEVDFVNKGNIVPLKNRISGENIPIEMVSTGTKQLLLTAVALDKISTKESVILIDEPERSLYPDMQMDIMEHYQNLAPESQFIVATHSPFIAASFEPEERFVLYFDEKGKVAVRSGSSPIGDDPNDMLYNDFGIDYINKFGKKVYNEYLEKRRQLLFEDNDEQIKKKLQTEIELI